LNEAIGNGSSDSQTTKNENTTAVSHVCNCNDKCLSPVIDSDQEQKDALMAARSVHLVLEQQIRSRNIERMNAELAPVQSEIDRLDNALLVFCRPSCFGCYNCSDNYLEACNHGNACRKKMEGGFRLIPSTFSRCLGG
jgi:hypothetical protein